MMVLSLLPVLVARRRDDRRSALISGPVGLGGLVVEPHDQRCSLLSGGVFLPPKLLALRKISMFRRCAVTPFAHGLKCRPGPTMANRCHKFAGGVMDDPTACWHRYLVAISALAPDEDEATQALIELVQWLAWVAVRRRGSQPARSGPSWHASGEAARQPSISTGPNDGGVAVSAAPPFSPIGAVKALIVIART
jgi:hypothetical protein